MNQATRIVLEPRTADKIPDLTYPGEYYLVDYTRLQIPRGAGADDRRAVIQANRERSEAVCAWRRAQMEAVVRRNQFYDKNAALAALHMHDARFPELEFYVTRGCSL